MTKFKVFCSYKNDWELNEFDLDQVDVTINPSEYLSRDDLLREVKGCHGLITYPRCRIDKEVLDAAGDQLKVISTTSAGFNHIDIHECARRGIPIGYLPDTFTGIILFLKLGSSHSKFK